MAKIGEAKIKENLLNLIRNYIIFYIPQIFLYYSFLLLKNSLYEETISIQ